jgi:hypothetical protein
LRQLRDDLAAATAAVPPGAAGATGGAA